MQSSMFDFRSGAATNANGTEASWDILIAPEGTYNVCWCGASEGSCTSGNDYSVQLGTLQVAKKRDCEVTDWWVVDECNKVCGGGEVRMKRAITQEATGGGEACPSQSELTKVEQCNMKPCPLARLDRVTLEPAKVYAGNPFIITIEGEWLDPESDRVLLIDPQSECGQTQVHHGGAACNEFSSSSYRLVCGNGDFSVRLQNPGTYKICVCDASASIQRSQDGSTNITTGNYEAAGIQGSGCATPDLYLHNPEQGAIIEAFEVVLPSETAPSTGLSSGELIGIACGGIFVVGVLGLVAAYWIRKKCFQPKLVKVVDESYAKEGKEGLEAGVDQNVLQFYESYYQSLGYPPGTAAQVLGASVGQQHQLALAGPMGGAMMAGAPAGTPALQDAAWMAPRPMSAPLQLALPPSRHPGMAPPTPQNRGRSPRGETPGKSFGDLVSESNRRPSRQLPLFTDTSLPKMPTPTATPRGVATPRQDEHSLALEDGKTEDAAIGGDEVAVTVSKSLEDVKEQRPSTADSVLSCLSDSTAGSGSRPGTGDSAKDEGNAGGKALSPVKEEREEEAKQDDSQSFRTFFNDRVTKLLSTEGDAERKPLFGSFSGKSFGDLVSESRRPSDELPEGAAKGDGEDAKESSADAGDAPVEATSSIKTFFNDRVTKLLSVGGDERKPLFGSFASGSFGPGLGDAGSSAPDAEEEAAKKAAAEEAARKAAEEEATRKAAEEEAAKKAAAEEAARKAAEEEAARKAAEEEAAKKAAAEEAARKAAAEEAARKAAEEEAAKKAAADEAARKAAEEEAARKAADEEAAKKAAADEAARKAAAEEAARKTAEEEAAKKAAADEAARKAAAEEAARKAAEEEAARKAAEEEDAKKQAAEEAARKAAAEEAARKAAEEEAARKAAEEEAARKAAEEEAAKKAAQEASASQPQTPHGQRRAPPPPPPRPKPKQLASPGGSRVGSMSPSPLADADHAEGGNSPSSAVGSGAASPSGSRADHSLHGLWQSQTPTGRMAGPSLADGEAEAGPNSPAGSAPNTGRLMTPTSARRAPGPMIPGPMIDTDFEDTLKSNGSFVSDSPGGRKASQM